MSKNDLSDKSLLSNLVSLLKESKTDFEKEHMSSCDESMCDQQEMTDEELEMFSRRRLGTRFGRNQSRNVWNQLKKRGRHFHSRTREDFDMDQAVFEMYEELKASGRITSLNEADIPANPKKIDNKSAISAIKGGVSMPDISQTKSNGSPYQQYRFGLALAGAPDYPTIAAGAVAGDPLLCTYTDEELEMIKFAAKQTNSGRIVNVSSNRSEEMPGVNTTSPVAKPKKNQYGV